MRAHSQCLLEQQGADSAEAWNTGSSSHRTAQTQHLPSVLLYSWAPVLLHRVRQLRDSKKSGFSCWQPCQAATEFESGWNLSQYCRRISIRECKLYAILTTKTSESITDLTEPHNALDTQSSPPYTSSGTSVPTAKCHNLGSSTAHLPSTAQAWASCSHNYQVESQVWLCRHSTAGAVQWGRSTVSVPPSPWSSMRHPAKLTNTDTGLVTSTQRNLHRLLPPNTITPGFWMLTTNTATERTSHFPLVALLKWGALFAIQAAGKASACPSAAVQYFMPTNNV